MRARPTQDRPVAADTETMGTTGFASAEELSPYDAEAAVVRLLDRLRQRLGASRVTVWVHEATTQMVVPYRQSVSAAAVPGSGVPVLDHAVPLVRAPLMSAVVRGRRVCQKRAFSGRPDWGPSRAPVAHPASSRNPSHNQRRVTS